MVDVTDVRLEESDVGQQLLDAGRIEIEVAHVVILLKLGVNIIVATRVVNVEVNQVFQGFQRDSLVFLQVFMEVKEAVQVSVQVSFDVTYDMRAERFLVLAIHHFRAIRPFIGVEQFE